MNSNINILHFQDNKSNDQNLEVLLIESGLKHQYVSVGHENDMKLVAKMFTPDVILFDDSYCVPYSNHVLSFVKSTYKDVPYLILSSTSKIYLNNFLEEKENNFVQQGNITNLIFRIKQAVVDYKYTEVENSKVEDKFRAIFENSHETFILIDADGRPIYQGSAAKRVTGFEVEETKGKTVFDFLEAHDKARIKTIFEEVSKNPDIPILSSFKIKHKNGQYIWVECTITNMLHHKSVKAYVVNYRDITAQVEAKGLLEKSESNLKTIFNNTKSAYVFADINFKVILFNPQASLKYKQELGIDMKVGDDLLSYLPEENRPKTKSRFESVLNNAIVNYETSFHHANERVSWYSVDMFPVKNKNNHVEGFVIASHEITERKTIELERARMTSEIASRNKDLEHFGHIISHNLRAPVANILGLANVMNSIPDLTKRDIQKCVDGFNSSASDLDEIVKDLNLILQARNVLDEKKEVIFLSELVREIENQFHDIIQRDGIKIRTKFAIDQICCVKSHLQVIFYSLISNSIKYHRQGVKQEILISSQKEYGKFLLKFKDNGIGIDLNKYKDKMFSPYNRFHPNRSGKGIGLYFAKMHADILHGDLKVSSNVNTGTEFSLEFADCT